MTFTIMNLGIGIFLILYGSKWITKYNEPEAGLVAIGIGFLNVIVAFI